MKRSRFGRRSGLSREAETLLWLSAGLSESGSQAEDAYWEKNLDSRLNELLEDEDEETLNAAMDQLYNNNPNAYQVLADSVEACTEQCLLDDGRLALLITAPILAWSRVSIPAGRIPATVLNNLRTHLLAHVLADKAQLVLADALLSPDQLPQGYSQTAAFLRELSKVAPGGTLEIDQGQLPETSKFLSDLRYILGAVIVQPGTPIFRWQEADGSKEHAATQWRAQGGACLTSLLSGCASELVLPEAYFAACRQSDSASRPYSVRASVAFLCTTLDLAPNEIRAIVAPFYENQLEEYRIGFTTRDSSALIHGVVWPLIGAEDENTEITAQIEAVLKESGVQAIQLLENRFSLEYCEDCGAPFYPSPEGELVHAELPEDKAEQIPKHLH